MKNKAMINDFIEVIQKHSFDKEIKESKEHFAKYLACCIFEYKKIIKAHRDSLVKKNQLTS